MQFNSMYESMKRCLNSVDEIRNDPYFQDRPKLIIEQMTLIWAHLEPKPISMLEWAKEIYKLHKASLD